MSAIFHTFFYKPLYNGFIFLLDVFPWLDAGVVVIIFTVLIKFIIFPLSKKASIAQIKMKKIEPEIAKIKEKYKNDKQEQARQTMNLYKESKINPFGSLLPILIQLPVIFALYFIFLKSGLPGIDTNLLYSFVSFPDTVNMNFLGLINITGKSALLAFLAAITSFYQIKRSMPTVSDKKERSFQNDFAKSMSFQMKYFFPVIVFFISYSISGVVALYWFTSNVFTIVQDTYIKKKYSSV